MKNAINESLMEIGYPEKYISGAQAIKALCSIVVNRLNFNSITNKLNIAGKTRSNTFSAEELMSYGAKLIYLLRTYFTGEEISFLISAKSSTTGQSESYLVPQSIILQNLSKVKGWAIGLQYNLLQDAFTQANKFSSEVQKIQRKNEWNRVLQLSEFLYIPGKNIHKIAIKTKKGKVHWAYQNQKKDNQIYAYYTKSQPIYYYNLSGGNTQQDCQYFNKGWLWEWYNSILLGASEEKYFATTLALQHGSIAPIIQSADNVAGTRAGDFMTAYNVQIQAKYNNQKIISYNNIKTLLYQLNLDLEQFIMANSQEQAQVRILNTIKNNFIDPAALMGNQLAEKTIEDLLIKLY